MYRLAFPPVSANGQVRPADSTLELSELLTRAKAAIDQAREQIQKTQTLIAESKENRESESALRPGFIRR